MNGGERIARPLGQVWTDGAGSWVRIAAPDGLRRDRAGQHAQREAEEAGAWRVVDFVSIDPQPDGSWIVELQVTPR